MIAVSYIQKKYEQIYIWSKNSFYDQNLTIYLVPNIFDGIFSFRPILNVSIVPFHITLQYTSVSGKVNYIIKTTISRTTIRNVNATMKIIGNPIENNQVGTANLSVSLYICTLCAPIPLEFLFFNASWQAVLQRRYIAWRQRNNARTWNVFNINVCIHINYLVLMSSTIAMWMLYVHTICTVCSRHYDALYTFIRSLKLYLGSYAYIAINVQGLLERKNARYKICVFNLKFHDEIYLN